MSENDAKKESWKYVRSSFSDSITTVNGEYLAVVVTIIDALTARRLDTDYYASRSISQLRISRSPTEMWTSSSRVLITPHANGTLDCEFWVPERNANPGLYNPEYNQVLVCRQQECTLST